MYSWQTNEAEDAPESIAKILLKVTWQLPAALSVINLVVMAIWLYHMLQLF